MSKPEIPAFPADDCFGDINSMAMTNMTRFQECMQARGNYAAVCYTHYLDHTTRKWTNDTCKEGMAKIEAAEAAGKLILKKMAQRGGRRAFLKRQVMHAKAAKKALIRNKVPRKMQEDDTAKTDDWDESWEEGDWDVWDWEDDWDWTPLHPDRRCLQWETARDDEECWTQWEDWETYCEYVDWNDQCDAVDDAWYSQDIEWQYPTPLSAECIVTFDQRSEACWGEWTTIYDQCYGEGPYEDQSPFMWTDDCEAAEILHEGFEEYNWSLPAGDQFDWWSLEDGSDAAMLKKRHNVLKQKITMREAKHPVMNERLALMTKAEEPAGFDTGSAVTGFAAGFTAVMAYAGIRALCKAQKTAKQLQASDRLL